VLPTSAARAGGIQLWELGTPDVGLAAAGWSARAQDAATLFKNPAGMNQLEVPQLEVGLQLGYGQFGFEASSGTTVPGNNGGNPVGLIPGGSLFWAQSVTDVVAVGVGVFSYFGSALSFDEGFVGRYNVESLGFAYDSSAVTDENRTVDAPMGQAFRFGLGAEWVIVPAVDLGLAYTLAWFGDMPVNQQGGALNGDVVGSYDNSAIHFIALSLQWNIGAKKDPDG